MIFKNIISQINQIVRTIFNEKKFYQLAKPRPFEKHHIPNLHAENYPKHSKHAIEKIKTPQLEKPY